MTKNALRFVASVKEKNLYTEIGNVIFVGDPKETYKLANLYAGENTLTYIIKSSLEIEKIFDFKIIKNSKFVIINEIENASSELRRLIISTMDELTSTIWVLTSSSKRIDNRFTLRSAVLDTGLIDLYPA
jgi:hypothetical protein